MNGEEELEEAAEKYAKHRSVVNPALNFKAGAQWQAKHLSAEQILNIVQAYLEVEEKPWDEAVEYIKKKLK